MYAKGHLDCDMEKVFRFVKVFPVGEFEGNVEYGSDFGFELKFGGTFLATVIVECPML
jgi:hypothetical protein